MRIEELDWADTEWGQVSLRRRVEPATGRVVHEVKLDEDYLMSSQFTVGECELARLGMAAVDGTGLRVLVGGLGLGYTAWTALQDERVAALDVVEALAPVISWHERDLFEDTRGLAADPRTTLVHDDFFDVVRAERVARPYDAVLLDIDHAPDWLLRSDHADFYTQPGQARAAAMLRPQGALAVWSDEPPDERMVQAMAGAFEYADAHVVSFPNHLTGGTAANTVYVAREPLSPARP
ncbi:spermidine synthase [Phycicoccus sp. CSK15P-2]|uniref:spermidine synthase n=1 Tax=Phycicoccus sp. CSK15P-2 TaxID=2807627 RepID=UPI00195190E9|nr:spermidine synthase [Phycicoccus sp. CSK15P-2]MBM6405717.1 spermidine synthase [Phycicoccus sp. CSK15P-2]